MIDFCSSMKAYNTFKKGKVVYMKQLLSNSQGTFPKGQLSCTALPRSEYVTLHVPSAEKSYAWPIGIPLISGTLSRAAC